MIEDHFEVTVFDKKMRAKFWNKACKGDSIHVGRMASSSKFVHLQTSNSTATYGGSFSNLEMHNMFYKIAYRLKLSSI